MAGDDASRADELERREQIHEASHHDPVELAGLRRGKEQRYSRAVSSAVCDGTGATYYENTPSPLEGLIQPLIISLSFGSASLTVMVRIHAPMSHDGFNEGVYAPFLSPSSLGGTDTFYRSQITRGIICRPETRRSARDSTMKQRKPDIQNIKANRRVLLAACCLLLSSLLLSSLNAGRSRQDSSYAWREQEILSPVNSGREPHGLWKVLGWLRKMSRSQLIVYCCGTFTAAEVGR